MVVRRFIAGAICQNCGVQDKIRAWTDSDKELMHRECVACGHGDTISLVADNLNELQTRVNYSDPVFEEDIQPLKLIINEKKS